MNYRSYLYGDMVTYQDYVCVQAFKGRLYYKLGFSKSGDSYKITTFQEGENITMFDTIEATSYGVYQIVSDDPEYGTSAKEVLNKKIASPYVYLSKRHLIDVNTLIEKKFNSMSLSELNLDQEILELFNNKEDIAEVYSIYEELKFGKSTINDESWNINITEERTNSNLQFYWNINRSLSKSERKEIKGKVSKES